MLELIAERPKKTGAREDARFSFRESAYRLVERVISTRYPPWLSDRLSSLIPRNSWPAAGAGFSLRVALALTMVGVVLSFGPRLIAYDTTVDVPMPYVSAVCFAGADRRDADLLGPVARVEQDLVLADELLGVCPAGRLESRSDDGLPRRCPVRASGRTLPAEGCPGGGDGPRPGGNIRCTPYVLSRNRHSRLEPVPQVLLRSGS